MIAGTSCRRSTLALVGTSLLLGLAGCTGGGTEGSRGATTVPPVTRLAPPAATDPGPLNGQLTDAQTHFGARVSSYEWFDYDPGSNTGLFEVCRDDDGNTRDGCVGEHNLVVVEATGHRTNLSCPHPPRCAPMPEWHASRLRDAALGPGPDEVTVGSGNRTARVIGYDGTVHRTVDLGATTARGAEVKGLRWTADGSRLAVLSGQDLGTAGISRVWLVDPDGGEAQLAYSLWSLGSPRVRHDATHGKGYLSGWGWSPDGRALLLEVRTRNSLHGADVVVLRLQSDGAATPVIAQTLYHSNRHFDWAGNIAWSPDGTRIAVRTRNHITEISAEDGRVITQHPQIEGWLIWPARNG